MSRDLKVIENELVPVYETSNGEKCLLQKIKKGKDILWTINL